MLYTYVKEVFTRLNAGAWSNGADLKSAVFALVGSNPTSSILSAWRNWIAHPTSNREAVGSSPAVDF